MKQTYLYGKSSIWGALLTFYHSGAEQSGSGGTCLSTAPERPGNPI